MTYQLHSLNQTFKWQPAKAPFKLISSEQAASWNESGYFLLEDAFTLEELKQVQADIDPMEEKTNEFLRTVKDRRQYIARADELTFALHPVLKSETVKSFAKHEVFAQLCIDLVGNDCRLYWDQAVYKKPRCPEEFPWHQDNGYNFISPQSYLTCWIPLVDATIDNGCPWVLPGVHKLGTLEHRHTDLGWQCLSGMEQAVPVEAKAGDVVVFSSLTPHRTGPNFTDAERKAYILQYCHDDSFMFPREGDQNVLQNHPDRQFMIVQDGQPVRK